MQITLFSLFMSVLWSSVLAAFNYFCRKKHFFRSEERRVGKECL